MPNEDREQKFERALARHLKNVSPDSACPDPETLAAYHECTLSFDEMAQWKKHVAGCVRCQETLALVEQSELAGAEDWERSNAPVPVEALARPKVHRGPEGSLERETAVAAPVTAMRTASHLRWRWAVPLGTIAAVVIVWVGVREVRMHRAEKTASVEMAKNGPTSTSLPPSVTSPQKSRQANEDRSASLEAYNRPPSSMPEPSTKTESADELRARRIVPPSSTDSKLLDKEQTFPKQKDLSGVVGGAVAAPAHETPTLRDDYAKSATEAAPPPAPVLTSPSASGGRSLPEAKKARGPSAAQATQMQVQVQAMGPANSTSSELPLNGRNDAGLRKIVMADRRYVATPNEKYLWRLGNAGTVERSSDKGQTWKLQNSGVHLDLTAGSATSEKICWVVGRVGTILLTTDGGKHWKQVPSPIAEDLGGVHAADALHASVWDVPNRQSFETKDGGVTWQRIANE